MASPHKHPAATGQSPSDGHRIPDCETSCAPSPATPETPTNWPTTATASSARTANDILTPSASSPAPGPRSSGVAGKNNQPYNPARHGALQALGKAPASHFPCAVHRRARPDPHAVQTHLPRRAHSKQHESHDDVSPCGCTSHSRMNLHPTFTRCECLLSGGFEKNSFHPGRHRGSEKEDGGHGNDDPFDQEQANEQRWC